MADGNDELALGLEDTAGTVSFGDVPSGYAAMLSINRTRQEVKATLAGVRAGDSDIADGHRLGGSRNKSSCARKEQGGRAEGEGEHLWMYWGRGSMW